MVQDSNIVTTNYCQIQSHVTKTRTNIENPPDQIYILCPSLRISGQSPAPIVNAGEECF